MLPTGENLRAHWPGFVYPVLALGYRTARLLSARGYPLHRNESYAPFFIVGSGRSGNTLLRRILQASVEVHIPPETFVLGTAIKQYACERYMPWPYLVRLVLGTFEFHAEFDKFGISLQTLARALIDLPERDRSLARILDAFYRYHGTATQQGFVRWGDKTPLNAFCTDWILAVFPDARFIHMVRDGADAVRSYVAAGLQPDVDSAARRWRRSVRAVETFARRHPDRCHVVRYESLVTQPVETVRGVCDFLGFAFDALMLDGLGHSEALSDLSSYEHMDNVGKPISRDSIGKGRRELTHEQKARAQALIGLDLRRLGYDPLV